MQKLIDQVELK